MFKRRWQKVVLAFAILIAGFIAFSYWYQLRYSMDVARAFEVNDAHAKSRVLIATQGSAFKDAVVAGVVDHLRPRAVYVKVIDISMLRDVNEDEWNAIVLIHTWQMGKPPEAAKAFVDRVRNVRKLVVLSTSGAGTFKIAGIDALSSASVMADAPIRAADIATRIDAVLGTAP